MKRIILLLTLFSYAVALYSQLPVKPISILNTEIDSIGNTWYDRQTNATIQNRIYRFDDGTIGATYIIGYDYINYSDRGTGYNYFNGNAWHEWPTERIESQWSGWSCYAPLGENGEINISHINYPDEGLFINTREIKGSGNWNESVFLGPESHEDVIFPSLVTNGENYSSIYLLCQTRPYQNGGSLYQGLDGALVYSMSTDGGVTWNIKNYVLPGMDSSAYTGFTGDCYTFSEPKDSIIAFAAGSYQHDLFLMKSTDYGQTFEKTLIWEHPYNLITPTFYTDTFYCVDGSIDVALDVNGKAHVVFGIMRTYYNLDDWKYFKTTDGVGYWNETMPAFSSNANALDPTCGPESELIVDETLIGWTQDLNGNGTIDWVGEPGHPLGFYFSLGVSSMVQLVADDLNRLFLVFSSITEEYHNGTMNYRRLFIRSSLNGGQTWGQFYHYDEEMYSIFTEYAFPSVASSSDDHIYLTYMIDWDPGTWWQGGTYPPSQDFICCAKVSKDEIVGIKKIKQSNTEIKVSQNYPNPFSETTTINVSLLKPVDIKLEVINMMGKKVYQMAGVKVNTGLNTLTINAYGLTPGIYFYTIKSSGQSITYKMIISK